MNLKVDDHIFGTIPLHYDFKVGPNYVYSLAIKQLNTHRAQRNLWSELAILLWNETCNVWENSVERLWPTVMMSSSAGHHRSLLDWVILPNSTT